MDAEGETAHAVVPYEIVELQDISTLSRHRLRVYVSAPQASTLQPRGDTAMQAAIDIQVSRGADVVTVFLEAAPWLAGQGFPLAIANYSPDGGGFSGSTPFRNASWEVDASSYELTGNDLLIAQKWFEAEPEHQVPDGFGGTMADEDAVARSVAEELGIPIADVKEFPLINIITTREDYDWGR